jgi:anti-sigma B factor antagonist
VVTCGGRIAEGAGAAELHEHVNALLRDEPFIILDLAEVQFIDSGGLGLLVRLLNRARVAQGDLKLCAVPPRIVEILRITRLGTILESHASEGDAVAAFYQRAAAAAQAGQVQMDILCVEASADVLSYIRELLRQAGYGVIASGNLHDALILLKATRPKAVVIGAEFRRSRETGTGERFNRLADGFPVVELPPDFAADDAGEAGPRLLDRIQAAIGESRV